MYIPKRANLICQFHCPETNLTGNYWLDVGPNGPRWYIAIHDDATLKRLKVRSTTDAAEVLADIEDVGSDPDMVQRGGFNRVAWDYTCRAAGRLTYA